MELEKRDFFQLYIIPASLKLLKTKTFLTESLPFFAISNFKSTCTLFYLTLHYTSYTHSYQLN